MDKGISLIFSEIENLALNERSIVAYTTKKSVVAKPQNEISLRNLRKNEPIRGRISSATGKRYRKVITTVAAAVYENNEFYFDKEMKIKRKHVVFNLLTFTLSSGQMHSDKQINRFLLTPCIQTLCRIFKVDFYVWVGETQKSGNIHYHVIVDRYIPHDALRLIWNSFQEKLGYISRYNRNKKFTFRNGFFYDKKRLERDIDKLRAKNKIVAKTGKIEGKVLPIHMSYLETTRDFGVEFPESILKRCAMEIQEYEFEKAKVHGFNNPNSTDIKLIKNPEQAAAYVTKYMLKSYVKPLAKNQKIITENNTEYLIQLDEKGETEVSKVVYVPEYLNRPITGRPCGHSKSFSSYIIVHEKVDPATKKTIKVEEIKKIAPLTIPIVKYDYFRDHNFPKGHSKSIFFLKTILEPSANKLLEFIEKEVGEKEMQKASSFCGEYFLRNGGKIYPFSKVKRNGKELGLRTLLENKAPELAMKLTKQRREIYNSIWKKSA